MFIKNTIPPHYTRWSLKKPSVFLHFNSRNLKYHPSSRYFWIFKTSSFWAILITCIILCGKIMTRRLDWTFFRPTLTVQAFSHFFVVLPFIFKWNVRLEVLKYVSQWIEPKYSINSIFVFKCVLKFWLQLVYNWTYQVFFYCFRKSFTFFLLIIFEDFCKY